MRAAFEGNLPQVQQLIALGAPVDAPTPGTNRTPLIFAAVRKHDDVLSYLIQKGANVNAAESNGSTALLYAAYANDLPACTLLLNAGANPDLGAERYRKPILYPARYNNIDMMKLFLAHHANVNNTGHAGPAIWEAVARDRLEIAKMLLDAGADVHLPDTTDPPDPKKPDLTLLAVAATTNDTALVDLLLAHGASLEEPGEEGGTVLESAILHAKAAMVVDLLTRGANPNATNAAGETPMILAARFQNPAVLSVLIDKGANLEARDPSGATPLLEVAKHGTIEHVKALVERGADVNAADNLGETALTYAGSCGETDIVAYLRQHGANRTDIRIIDRPQASPPLAPERAWALAVAAIYFQVNDENPHLLGGDDWLGVGGTRAMLVDQWGITDRATLLSTLIGLHEGDHRSLMVEIGARAAQRSDPLWDFTVTDPLLALKLDGLRDSYQKWKDRMGLAWDLCRYVAVAHWGVNSGYIGEDEAWNLITPVAKQVQAQFGSWREMNDNFFDGRKLEMPDDPRFQACANLLLNPKDPNSVWNTLPWQTDLGK